MGVRNEQIMKVLISNPIYGDTSKAASTHWLKEEDCPIIINNRIVTFNPKKMLEEFEYYFPYEDEQRMALKHKDGTIDIYRVIDGNGSLWLF